MSEPQIMPKELSWSGERYVPQLGGNIRVEHLHRYLMARDLCRGRRVLDIACGEGYGSAMLSQVAARVYGVDIAEETVSHARARYGRPQLEFQIGSCSAIPLPDASVDVVVSFETIEHHGEHDAMMREVRRVLVPGGTLVISSPDRLEYSDVPQYRNPFHVRELYRAEFDDLLRTYFAHVTIAGQRVKAGSLVWPLDSSSVQRFEGFDASGSSDEVEPLGPALYLIAVASDQPVAALPTGFLDGGGFVWFGDHTAALQAAEADFHTRVRQLDAARAERARAAALEIERACLTERVSALDTSVKRLQSELGAIESSHSWRLTAPLRRFRSAVAHGRPIGDAAAAALREMYAALPLSTSARLRIRAWLFRAMPVVFRRTAAYRAWDTYRRTHAQVSAGPTASGTAPVPPAAWTETLYAGTSKEFVPLTPSPGVDTRIKAIAFYLPQFHPIPENDRWWGKGFTEWTNVARGRPQFEGHYQPHLPGELGFYDLRLPEVQRRQAELAKAYGLYGFCYHHYWFGGTRLLRQPLEQLLAAPEIVFPFCLCWANENWTRRWDGKDAEILVSQHHSPEDDLAFIQDIEPALRDPRYIKVDGKPLLLVYRPSLLPDARATAARWRAYCRDAGIGELYLVSTHAFDRVSPLDFGFDAATEFAPNNIGATPITDSVRLLNPDFKGAVYDYRYLVEYSQSCLPPADFTLFRSVTPMWDNVARRSSRGTVFAHSSPSLYREALEHVCRYTDRHLPERPIVFINAWNEWAEGAHLEPDQRHGYAYLQATADALARFPTSSGSAPLVVVSHDAYVHGAQLIALAIVRTLVERMGRRVEVLLCGDGPLRAEFEKLGRVHDFFSARATPQERTRIIHDLFAGGARIALCNTSVVGATAAQLKEAGFCVVALVHELPGLIDAHGLHASARTIADCSDHVVFPAQVVRDRFVEMTGLAPDRAVVRPQGIFAPNRYRGRRAEARAALRSQLGVEPETQIALGVGYADRRKGVDLFVDVGLKLLQTTPGFVLVWVGHGDATMMAAVHERLEGTGLERRFLFPGLVAKPDLYYAGADVFLMTSREDPFPMVVLEALDAEIPVVGFEDAGGFVELLRRGCGTLVSFGDTSAMAAAVTRLLADAGERTRVADAGRHVIDTEFDYLSYTRALVHLASPTSERVSVIVPNYNYARYLPGRLRSIFAQTYRPHEIIVLDDCSSDDSLAVAEAISRESPVPIRIIANEANQGCYRQWLKGIREASGDLIWIAEADDTCEPTLLARLMPAFSNPSVVLAYCQSRQIDDSGRVLAPDYLAWTDEVDSLRWRGAYVRPGRDEIVDALAIKNTIPNVSAVVFRRPDLSAIADQLAGMRNAGDWLIYVHVLEQGDVAFIPEPLNDHRRHQGSLTIGQGGLNLMKEILQVQQHIRSRHAVSPTVEARRVTHLQTVYEYLHLNEQGPPSFQDHEQLRVFLDATVA